MKNQYKLTIQGLSLDEALDLAEHHAQSSIVYVDQDKKARGDRPHFVHGRIEKLTAYPRDEPLTIESYPA